MSSRRAAVFVRVCGGAAVAVCVFLCQFDVSQVLLVLDLSRSLAVASRLSPSFRVLFSPGCPVLVSRFAWQVTVDLLKSFKPLFYLHSLDVSKYVY